MSNNLKQQVQTFRSTDAFPDTANRDALTQLYSLLNSSPIVHGNLLTSVTVNSGSQTPPYSDIPHGLGRPWQGFLVVEYTIDNLKIVVNRPRAEVDDTKFIRLWRDGTVAADYSLWVF